MSNAPKELYEFDKFRLDVSERILWREGKRLPLSEKAFDTLCALVRRGNHLVGKDELLTEVWADAIVEENNLDKNISILRKVLGETSGKGKYIETVRGHGFRSIAEIRKEGEKGREGDEEKERRGEGGIFEGSAAGAFLSEPSASAGGLNAAESQISDSKFQISNQSDSKFQIENPLADNSQSANQSEVKHLKSQINRNAIPNPKSQIPNLKRLIAVFGGLIIGLSLFGFYVWQRGEKSAVADAPVKTIAVLPFKSLGAENRNEALELGMADTLIAKLGGEEITVRPLGSVSRYATLNQDSLLAGRELAVETVLDGTEKGMFTEAIAATNKAREIALGEREKTLDYLEKAFAEKDVRMVWLKVEPKWNNLRNEPRFIELMRRMNFE